MKLISQSLVGRAVSPSLGSSWLYYTLLLHSTNYYQTQRSFKFWCCHGLHLFLGLGLTVTEINIKKEEKQDLIKNIKNVNGCGDGMPKSM